MVECNEDEDNIARSDEAEDNLTRSDEAEDYLTTVFDHGREGLRHIGCRIAGLLDLRSLVALKRSCRGVEQFLAREGGLEARALSRKLSRDWGEGEPRVSQLSLGPRTAVTGVKLLPGGQEVLASVARNIFLFPVSSLQSDSLVQTLPASAVAHGLKLRLRLPSNSLNAKINAAFSGQELLESSPATRKFSSSEDNLEKNQVTQFDLLNDCLVAGNNNGILSIWDFHTGELLSSKQLFGIITGLRCLPAEDSIVTTHAGKAFDMGVVSVRKMVSPTELTVVWSVYQDIMPVFCFGVTSRYPVLITTP